MNIIARIIIIAVAGVLGTTASLTSDTTSPTTTQVITTTTEAKPPATHFSETTISTPELTLGSATTIPARIANSPLNEFNGLKLPTIDWILEQARCEHGYAAWEDRGQYNGAFGFMDKGFAVDNNNLATQSTWGRWGGWTYAKHAWQATPDQQITIFLRIYYTGWTRTDGYHRKPSSPARNGCRKAPTDKQWATWNTANVVDTIDNYPTEHPFHKP